MRFLLFTLILFSINASLAQESLLNFKIIHKGDTIGTLKAKKKILGDKIHYYNHTAINTSILFTTIKVDYNYTVIYNKDELVKATAKIELNDKPRTSTFTEKHSSFYNFYENGKKEKRIDEPIAYSTINLLFEEPIPIKKVYAEEHGEFHQLNKVKAHSYEKTNSKGKINTYHYKNGDLVKAIVDIGIISFEIVKG